MKLIIGLGNPGKKYESTRHNLGFMAVDELAFSFEPFDVAQGKLAFSWRYEKRFKAEILEIECNKEKIILCKPQTYMNESGIAVKLVASYRKLESNDIWVIHDDLDFPFGFLKIRFGGRSGGHKGVESIINSLGSDKFWRFRIGIGSRDQISKIEYQTLRGLEDYVLRDFASEEKEKAKEMIKKGSDAVKYALEEGLEKAMNRYNNS